MNIENLENDLISFDLSDEDLQAIRGGNTADASGFRNEDIVLGSYRWDFEFPITCVVTIGPGGKPIGGPIKAPVQPIQNLN